MWVCIEIDLDNVKVWSQVDKILCEEFGLIHVVWGVDNQGKNLPCKLPSNLFFGTIGMREKELSVRIQNLLSPFRIGYNLMVMENSWSHERVFAPKEGCSLVPDNSEVSNREE